MSLPEVEGMVEPSWPPRDDDSDGASLTASDEADQTFPDRAGPQESNDWLATVREPDPMRRLIWFETALVFGALVPLLLPLLALQLFVDAHILEWRLRKAPSTVGEGKPLLIQRGTMQCHVPAVLVLQSALSMFFFVDSQLQGWQGVVVVLPLICVGMVVAQVWGLQLRDLWLLVYHKSPPPDMEEEVPHRVTEGGSRTTLDELRASELINVPGPMGAEEPEPVVSPMHDEGGFMESLDDGAFQGE